MKSNDKKISEDVEQKLDPRHTFYSYRKSAINGAINEAAPTCDERTEARSG